MTRCTESCSEFICCPLAPYRAEGGSADEGRMAPEERKNVGWYLVIGGTLLAIGYVTLQLMYLLPALRG